MSFLLIRVGSGANNDVVMMEPSVSKAHLEIFVDVEGNTFLTDLNSENGTFVNGQRVQDSVELQPFDQVTLGENVPFDWNEIVKLHRRNTISVGSGADNDVVIASEGVAEKHLQLFRDHNGNIYITDLDSSQGTYINGERLYGIALLNESDKVKVGSELFLWRKLYPDLDPESAIEKEQEPVIEVPVSMPGIKVSEPEDRVEVVLPEEIVIPVKEEEQSVNFVNQEKKIVVPEYKEDIPLSFYQNYKSVIWIYIIDVILLILFSKII